MSKYNYIGSNVTIMVKSMAKSIKFYTETLGLPLRVRHSSHWAEIDAGGLIIGLHPFVKTKKIIRGDNMTIGLEVDDFETAIQKLEQKGIQFDIQKDGVVLAYFNDPDDNVLYLFQYKSKGQKKH
jgi:catechol 2,3-dioxygenase-like lactoylglutathione lyase family enzyme